MRFDTPIYFQRVQPGTLDENTHNYGEDTIFEDKVFAGVSTTTTETLKIVYGDIKQNSLTIKLQMPYKKPFDRIKVGDKLYKVDSAKQLRNKQVFVVSEVPGSYTGNSASVATYEDGYKDGFTDGEAAGYNNGYTKGEVDGKQAENDAFWNAVLVDGLVPLKIAFAGETWNNVTFRPNQNLVIQDGSMRIFYMTGELDLHARLSEKNLKIDFSNCKKATSCFYDTKITRLPELDIRTFTVALSQFIYNCTELVSIEKIIIWDESNGIISTSTFSNLPKLEQVIFEGCIYHGLSISSAPLNAESAKSIINCLKDHSGTEYEYKYKVSFSSTTKEYLEAEGATAPNGLTWLEYAYSKGWNY